MWWLSHIAKLSGIGDSRSKQPGNTGTQRWLVSLFHLANLMSIFDEVSVPTLFLDETRTRHNIQRMADKARAAAAFAAARFAALERQAVTAKTVLRIVDRSRHRCEHKENKRNGTTAQGQQQAWPGENA